MNRLKSAIEKVLRMQSVVTWGRKGGGVSVPDHFPRACRSAAAVVGSSLGTRMSGAGS